jgi:hypothetical protein
MSLPPVWPGQDVQQGSRESAGRYLVLDILCKKCERPGKRTPRMARFVRRSNDPLADNPKVGLREVLHRLQEIGVQPFRYKGQEVIPYCHRRADGGRTWYLVCPHGHEQRVREERIAATFDTIAGLDPDGNGSARVSL